LGYAPRRVTLRQSDDLKPSPITDGRYGELVTLARVRSRGRDPRVPDGPSPVRPARDGGRTRTEVTETLGAALVGIAGIALSVFQAGLSRDSPGAHWSVALLGIAAVALTVLLGRHRQRRTSRGWAGPMVQVGWRWRARPRAMSVSVLVWTVLIVGVIGWDLVSFIAQSSSFPTLSTLVGHITRYRVGRGLVFAFWFALGCFLVAGYRARSPE
jgi:RsiW-degrading membrane proteinase PrsW (M82 family)